MPRVTALRRGERYLDQAFRVLLFYNCEFLLLYFLQKSYRFSPYIWVYENFQVNFCKWYDVRVDILLSCRVGFVVDQLLTLVATLWKP